MKEGNSIIDFLSVIGAHNALMEFENVRIVKEMRNNVNRVVNCETANLNKVVQAAVEQLESIRYLEKKGYFGKLPAALRETAELRLENPDASLAELAKAANGMLLQRLQSLFMTVTANTAKMQCRFWNIILLAAAMNGLPK